MEANNVRSKPVYAEKTGQWVVWGDVGDGEQALVTSEGLAAKGLGYITAEQAQALADRKGAKNTRIARLSGDVSEVARDLTGSVQVAPIAPTEKQPWEITKNEWNSGAGSDHFVRERQKNYGVFRPGQERYYRWHKLSDGTRVRISKGTYDEIRDSRFSKSIAVGHWVYVKNAVREGTPVSETVLADYPDIVAFKQAREKQATVSTL